MKNNLSKILSIVLCLVLLGTMCTVASAAAINGSGTKKNPYIISTAADLDAFAAKVAQGESFSGKFIRLENDVTVSSGFAPIGSEDTPFKGTFDGNGKAITGLNVTRDYAALFGYTEGAVITDLTVAGTFKATSYAGAIAAYAVDTTIEGCSSSAKVYADNYAGGIAGFTGSGKIAECGTTADAIVVGYVESCGGIAGYSAAEIVSCTNRAYVNGAQNTGGIVGAAKADVISCTNLISISASKSCVGGIAGVTEADVKYSKNTGKISTSTSSAGKAGGIAGVAYGSEITECHNAGEVSARGTYAGGIAGYMTDTDVTNCITTAAVSTTSSYAGGIFGFALNGKVSYCVSTAGVTGKSSTGAGIGALSQATVANCYYNSDKTSVAVLSGKTESTSGIASAGFVTASALSALDFVNVWTINTIHAPSYPLLKSIPYHTVSITSSKDADCTNNGHVTGSCTDCFEKLETVIPATGHTYSVVSSKLPTCTAAGYKDYLCAVCGSTDSETIAATGHTDADENSVCDTCNVSLKDAEQNTEKGFLEKIGDFFRSILNWIKSIFVR